VLWAFARLKVQPGDAARVPLDAAVARVAGQLTPQASGAQRRNSCSNRDFGLGTARQETALERWTNPKPRRRACSCRYGVSSCRGKSAGVAKRPRERSPTRQSPSRFATLCTAVWRRADS
jgi:hypothetical protein